MRRQSAARELGGGDLLKAVTFDLWWTIFMPEDEHALVRERDGRITKILQDAGYRVEPAGLSCAVGAARTENYRLQIEEGLNLSCEDQVRLVLQELGVRVAPRLFERLVRVYSTPMLKVHPCLVDGVREVLKTLCGRLSLGLICNTGATPGWVVRRVMVHEDLASFFKVLVFSDELKLAKPNPLIFHKTLAMLGVGVEEALHVGDDPVFDVEGATRAGLRVVWFNSRNLETRLAPYATITRMRELITVIEQAQA